MKTGFLLFFVIFSSLVSYGQEDLYVWKTSMWSGIIAPQNNFVLPTDFSEPAFGVDMSRKLSPAFSLNSGFGVNVVDANMVYSSLSFRFNNGWILKERARLSPFLGAGASYIGLNDVNSEHINVFTEAGLKLKISDRLSTGLSYITFVPASEVNFNIFPDKELMQAIKLSVSFHFGDKSKPYKAPQFYSTELLHIPIPEEKKPVIETSVNKIIPIKKDSVIVKTPEAGIDSSKVEGLDSTTLKSAADSLDLSEVEMPDSISLQASAIDSTQEFSDDSTINTAVISYDIIEETPITNELLVNEENILDSVSVDSLVAPTLAAVSIDTLEKSPSKQEWTGDINIFVNDSTVTLKMDKDKSLVIKFQPQYIIQNSTPAPAQQIANEGIPAVPAQVTTKNFLIPSENAAVKTKVLPQETIPANPPASLQQPAGITEASSYISQTANPALSPAAISNPASTHMYVSTAEMQALTYEKQNIERDSSELSYIKEQNNLLFEILKHLSGVNETAKESHDSTLINENETLVETEQNLNTAPEKEIQQKINNNSPEEWNAKLISLEDQIAGLNKKLDLLSEKLSVKDSTLAVVKSMDLESGTELKQTIEPIPVFRASYPVKVYYGINESAVQPAYLKIIEDVSLDQIENPDYNIMISGFTDKSGNSEYNKYLSLKRAEILKAKLISYGINAESVFIVGFGDKNAEQEVFPSLERRTEIQLIKIIQ